MTAERLVFEAPAKVNLCLAVSYPPRDGYHLLDSVFFELPLADSVCVERASIDDVADHPAAAATAAGTLVALECGALGIPTQDNLVFKAVDGFERAVGAALVPEDGGIRISVDKRIPAGGGLGGGSSDAAATLRACCALAGLSEGDPRVEALARMLGADVAFFLHGGTALMGGRGDLFEEDLPPFPLPLVLMGESQGISTPRIYRDFDAKPAPAPDARALAAALRGYKPGIAGPAQKQQLAQLCANNLEPAAFDALPRLRERVERARHDEDVLNALVTGSGATSFAICPDSAAALRFAQRARAYCDWTLVCRPR